MIARLTNGAMTAIATAAWLAVAWVFWLAYFDSNNLTVRESFAMSIDGKPASEFRAGDTFFAHRDICVSKVSPGEFSIEIRSEATGAVYTVAQGRTGQVSGCTVRNVPTRIPESLKPGPYTVCSYASYDVNALRNVRYELPPIPFVVVQ